MVSEEQIYQIESQETFGKFTVKRVNISDFEVIHKGVIVFKGEDYEVADFMSENNK
ncbi:hypothetical protein [Cytobacillus firmus]|uniref:hypothetical protein n=1 Tax=Cytobacillus firmus TaxID=1399 RepID=UPI0004B42E7D|nr:hypothetical protein [Cytobacillus firmus]